MTSTISCHSGPNVTPTKASRPAMLLTGLMCGLRPGELVGLRWPFVDIDSASPSINVVERAAAIGDVYVGQAAPKTERGRRRIGLHPTLVVALLRHRKEQQMLGLYEAEGFVFGTRNGTPMTMANMRRAFKSLCERAGLGSDWTTYELRHSFVSLVSSQLDDLVKVADLAGHVDTRTTEGYRHQVRRPCRTRSKHGIECLASSLKDNSRWQVQLDATPVPGAFLQPRGPAGRAITRSARRTGRSRAFHHLRVSFREMSLRFRALVTVTILVVGALAWTSAASADSSHRVVTQAVCDVSYCDTPAPDSCRTVCPHAPRLVPEMNPLTIQVPLLRSVDFAPIDSVASRLNLSERLHRPPR